MAGFTKDLYLLFIVALHRLEATSTGGEYFGEQHVVDVHLGHICEKLGRDGLIVTVRGVGYRFEDEPL